MTAAGTVRLRLDPGTRVWRDGAVLVGGRPRRLLRLTPAAAAAARRWQAGRAVADTPTTRQLAAVLIDRGMAEPDPGAAAHTPRDVAAVIPVRDDWAGLAAALASVHEVREVVVVDDGSGPAAAARIAAIATRLGARVVRRPEPGGPAAARRTGMAATSAPLLAFVDADCAPPAGWVEALLPHFGAPQVAAVAPRVTGPPAAGLRGRFEQTRSPLDRGAVPGLVRPGTRTGFVPAAALLARRDAVEAVGSFAPDLRVGEDVDLVWRLAAAGWQVRYDPTVTATHPARDGLRAWLGQRYRYGTSAARLARRHPGRLAAAAVPWQTAPWAAAAAAGRWRAAAGAAAAATVVDTVRLRWHGVPWVGALRTAAASQAAVGCGLARAVTRPWWPAAVVAATLLPATRPGLAGAAVGTAVADWWRVERPAGAAGWIMLHLLDDVAYGAGVWMGCLWEGTVEPLLPRVG